MHKVSKSGYKLVYYRDSTDDYLVSIQRPECRFNQAFDTIEEAIEVRDRTLEFYDRFNRFPTSQELGLKRRKNRRRRTRSSDRYYECSICGQTFFYRSQDYSKRFEESDHICGYCKRHRPSRTISADLESSANEEKYIYLNEHDGKVRYRVAISKDRTVFFRTFQSLAEAIEIRDKVIEFYNDFCRSPDDEEQIELFGAKKEFSSSNERISDFTPRSNTDQRNISYNKTLKRYAVQLTRQGKKFSAVSVTLEDAIRLRDEVLEFYKLYDHLPTKLEYRASLKKGTLL